MVTLTTTMELVLFLMVLFLFIRTLRLGQMESFIQNDPRLALTPPYIKSELIKLMEAVHDTFEEHGITYWAIGGTLLGAIRHGDLIPWDDDLDIAVPENFKMNVLSLQKEFRKRGYGMASGLGGLVIFPLSGELDIRKFLYYLRDQLCLPSSQRYFPRYPYLDIFWVKAENPKSDKIGFTNSLCRYLWPNQEISLNELGRIPKMPFDKTQVRVPEKYSLYLDRTFGKGWNKMGIITHIHYLNLKLKKPIICNL